jgi:hypothetical protein
MFTGKVFAYLLNNHIKIVKLEDLKRANTFFKIIDTINLATKYINHNF